MGEGPACGGSRAFGASRASREHYAAAPSRERHAAAPSARATRSRAFGASLSRASESVASAFLEHQWLYWELRIMKRP